MQIPILSGIYADTTPDLRVSYPVNMMPVSKQSGVNVGYLRPADGIIQHGTGPGISRGAINWNGAIYRVMGTSLVREYEDGTITTLGDVGAGGNVTFDYSFDRLAVSSGGRLYYWDGAALTQVNDVDLGTVVDVVWVDGYFMTTDGTNLVVTELTDPTQVNPLKYGSSELDPDPVLALRKLRNEIYVGNRYTVEVFDNIGGDFFPFQRIDGAQLQKGVIGTHACCIFADMFAFVGSGRNEPPSVYMGQNATTQRVATDDIDKLLATYSEADLAGIKIEARMRDDHRLLYIHLPDRTIVFDYDSSQKMGQLVWFTLISTMDAHGPYLARDMVWCYDRWNVANPIDATVGHMVDTVSTHWGQHVRWEFGTQIIYNESRGAIFHDLELVALTGSVALGAVPQIATSYTTDGVTWSQDKWISAGTQGARNKRLLWMQQGGIRNWRAQRFRGDSQAHMSFIRLEARLEPLAY